MKKLLLVPVFLVSFLASSSVYAVEGVAVIDMRTAVLATQVSTATFKALEEEAEYVLQFKSILEETQEEDDEIEHSDDELESYMDMRKKAIYKEANYSSEEMSDPEEEYENMLTSVYEEEEYDDEIDEERYYVKKPRQTELNTLKKQKDTSHLDILLFMISGVLMIFIMEQFVQIGMKMKKETVV